MVGTEPSEQPKVEGLTMVRALLDPALVSHLLIQLAHCLENTDLLSMHSSISAMSTFLEHT